MLTSHALSTNRPAALGAPCAELAADEKFNQQLDKHIAVGEQLAQTALQTELLVCAVCDVPPDKYIRRSQYPQFVNKPSVFKNGTEDKFASPAANFWEVLGSRVQELLRIRSTLNEANMVYNSSSISSPLASQCPKKGLRTGHCGRPLSGGQGASAL